MPLPRLRLTLLVLPALLVAACGGDGEQAAPAGPLEGSVELVASLPHAGKAWTEGLQVVDGVLWESTGLNGESEVRGIDLTTGDVLWSVPNPEGAFNEGLVHAFGKTYVLTYKEGKAYVFDRDATEPYRVFAAYEGEGWGLTAVGDLLVNSNGSAGLYYRDSGTFEVVREVEITYDGGPVERLNELEYDGTHLWVNQWQSPYVYAILESDPSQVTRFTLPSEVCPGGTPNGIAWDEDEGLFYLTGQRCEKIWKVRFR